MEKNITFNGIKAEVYRLSPFQRKKIEKFHNTKDDAFFDEADFFFKKYASYLQSQKIDIEYAVNAYLAMCKNMMSCQIYFMKNGKYPASSAAVAFNDVYSNEESMKSYMFGLALSQFLWSTHYEMYSCLKNALDNNSNDIKSYLEIGPGHGLFLSKALETLSDEAKLTAIDISPISMNITKSIVNYFHPEAQARVDFHTGDMLDLNFPGEFDFITMGEVIEHVNNPDVLLRKLCNLLSVKGNAFISTCVDCPAIDHVYHFKSVEEIREMLHNCGLEITEECILPVEDMPLNDIVKNKITINYCAIVKKLT